MDETPTYLIAPNPQDLSQYLNTPFNDPNETLYRQHRNLNLKPFKPEEYQNKKGLSVNRSHYCKHPNHALYNSIQLKNGNCTQELKDDWKILQTTLINLKKILLKIPINNYEIKPVPSKCNISHAEIHFPTQPNLIYYEAIQIALLTAFQPI